MEINLREKTVILLGPIKTTMQNLAMSFTSQGADVAMIDADADRLQLFARNLCDQRETNEKAGRAVAISVNWEDPNSLKDAIGKAAQTFGGIEIVIDGLAASKPTPLMIGQDDPNLEKIIQENLLTSLRASQVVCHFLKGRKRGRIVYLLQDSMNRGLFIDAVATAARTGLISFSKSLSKEMREFGVTVNCLSLGLTEEYLLGHFPDSPSMKEAMEKMKAVDPALRITEPEKISNALVFLCGPSGQAINGQHIVLS